VSQRKVWKWQDCVTARVQRTCAKVRAAIAERHCSGWCACPARVRDRRREGYRIPIRRGTWVAESVVVVGVRLCPQPLNLKDPMKVAQLYEPLLGMYSFVYQKVQSSLGSIRRAE